MNPAELGKAGKDSICENVRSTTYYSVESESTIISFITSSSAAIDSGTAELWTRRIKVGEARREGEEGLQNIALLPFPL